VTLFLHDAKHDRVLAGLELGLVTPDQRVLLEKVIGFFENQGLVDRYAMPVLANGWRMTPTTGLYDDEVIYEVEFT